MARAIQQVAEGALEAQMVLMGMSKLLPLLAQVCLAVAVAVGIQTPLQVVWGLANQGHLGVFGSLLVQINSHLTPPKTPISKSSQQQAQALGQFQQV
jgi:hypothetical protein